MDNYTLINKKFVLSQNAQISTSQRACKFGDGIFETCKIFNGVIYDFESHKKRLEYGLEALEIEFDTSDLKENCYKLIKKNKLENGILKISISRGIGSMGYLPAENIEALEIIETTGEKKINRDKIIIGVSKIKLYKKPSFLQKCKTMQSLNYVLAKIAARKKSFFDDVMISDEGFVGECSSSNIFWIKNGKIYTSSLKCNILSGTVRQKILQKFVMKINIVEASISRLLSADEIFLTNSNFLVLAVDMLVFNDKKIKFQKKISDQVLNFINEDLKNYCLKNAPKK